MLVVRVSEPLPGVPAVVRVRMGRMTATPSEQPAVPTAAAPMPPVPYGPPVSAPGTTPDAGATIDLSGRSVAGTAGKWAFRLLLPLLIRAIFRAIFR